jgi:hypothetical protein
MIKTVSDFLEMFVENKKEKLKKYDYLNHPGMIGDIYEGLSKNILSKSIFSGFNIKIVDGKVRNHEGDLSNQIDSMIVVGDGEKIPYTQHYIYNNEDVIAVCESKKNLFSKEIGDSFTNIKAFNKTLVPNLDQLTESRLIRYIQFLTNQKYLSPTNKNSEENQKIYAILMIMLSYPLRIIIGYDGFSDEINFRKGFIEYLKNHSQERGSGINSLPDLFICNKYSLVKHNFQPFMTAMDKTRYFPIISSGTVNPFYYLVCMIWSKLQLRFNLSSEIWGDDDTLDCFIPLIKAKMGSDFSGWIYQTINPPKSIFGKSMEKVAYSPFFVSDEVFNISNILCREEKIDLFEIGLSEKDIEKVRNEMQKIKFFHIEENEVSLISESLLCVYLPDGRNVIGDDIDGAFSRWIKKYNENKKT